MLNFSRELRMVTRGKAFFLAILFLFFGTLLKSQTTLLLKVENGQVSNPRGKFLMHSTVAVIFVNSNYVPTPLNVLFPELAGSSDAQLILAMATRLNRLVNRCSSSIMVIWRKAHC